MCSAWHASGVCERDGTSQVSSQSEKREAAHSHLDADHSVPSLERETERCGLRSTEREGGRGRERELERGRERERES